MKRTTKEAEALKAIAEYVEKKKPATLEEARHMLAAISVIATETLTESAEAA